MGLSQPKAPNKQHFRHAPEEPEHNHTKGYERHGEEQQFPEASAFLEVAVPQHRYSVLHVEQGQIDAPEPVSHGRSPSSVSCRKIFSKLESSCCDCSRSSSRVPQAISFPL